jgi:hypothetical protein
MIRCTKVFKYGRRATTRRDTSHAREVGNEHRDHFRDRR